MPGPTQDATCAPDVAPDPMTDHVASTRCGLPFPTGTTKSKLCADNVLRTRSKSQSGLGPTQVPDVAPAAMLQVKPVPRVAQSASVVQAVVVGAMVHSVSCEKRLLLSCWKRSSYTTQLLGRMPSPLPSTVTQTSIPTSAVALGTVVEIFVSVKRPVTSEGRISSVTPLPLDVEMLALNSFTWVPPLKLPPVPIAQDAEVPVALKLPLDCAWATLEPSTVKTAATARRDASVLIGLPPFARRCRAEATRFRFHHR